MERYIKSSNSFKISQKDFYLYKRIFREIPNYQIVTTKSYWREFVYIKWLLIAVIGTAIASFFWLPAAGLVLIISSLLIYKLLTGTGSAMLYYTEFLNKKSVYNDELKRLIITTAEYDDFIKKASKINLKDNQDMLSKKVDHLINYN